MVYLLRFIEFLLLAKCLINLTIPFALLSRSRKGEKNPSSSSMLEFDLLLLLIILIINIVMNFLDSHLRWIDKYSFLLSFGVAVSSYIGYFLIMYTMIEILKLNKPRGEQ